MIISELKHKCIKCIIKNAPLISFHKDLYLLSISYILYPFIHNILIINNNY